MQSLHLLKVLSVQCMRNQAREQNFSLFWAKIAQKSFLLPKWPLQPALFLPNTILFPYITNREAIYVRLSFHANFGLTASVTLSIPRRTYPLAMLSP